MEVIALRGQSDKGKSETLNIVYQLMLQFGYLQTPPGPAHFRMLGNLVQRDFIDILERKGKKVGIATMGDYGGNATESVKNLLAYLDSQGCDVAVCACRIGIASILNAVVKYPIHHFIDKTVTSNPHEERIKNAEDAEKIYKLI